MSVRQRNFDEGIHKMPGRCVDPSWVSLLVEGSTFRPELDDEQVEQLKALWSLALPENQRPHPPKDDEKVLRDKLARMGLANPIQVREVPHAPHGRS